jgi:peptide/nickel transport system substrate-binding protein
VGGRAKVALLLALAAAATGCGGDDAATGGPGAAAAEAAPDADAAPDRDATLRWAAIGNGGGNYDPHLANNPGSTQYLSPAYDRLVYLDPDGQLQPMLALSWETSPDGLALTFDLRPDVTFHDGTAFDAAAVRANIERGQTVEGSSVRPDLASIESVEVVSDLEVRLVLSAPNAALPAILSDRPGMMISPAAFDDPDLALQPVGAGPYRVVDHEPGTRLVFERFDGYWDPEAQRVRRIEMTMQLDSETRLRSLTSGQSDAMLLFADQLAEAQDAGVVVGEAPEVPQVLMLFLNKAEPPLADPDVRRAISHAIDREGIAEALFDGRCVPTSQPFAAGGPAADPAVDVDDHDVARASELLAGAGFADGFEFDSVMANVGWLVAVAEAVQAQLAEVGIDMQIEPLEPAQVLGRFLTEQSADTWFSALQSQVDPAKSVNLAMLGTSVYNPGGYVDAAIEQLAPEAVATSDAEERAGVYREISGEFAEDAFHIPICSLPTFFAHAPNVHGLRPSLTNTFDFREVWVASE